MIDVIALSGPGVKPPQVIGSFLCASDADAFADIARDFGYTVVVVS